MSDWISIQDRLPTHIYNVLVFIIGGPYHHGEDYVEIGIYRPDEKDWRTYYNGEDVTVHVSHWQNLPEPPPVPWESWDAAEAKHLRLLHENGSRGGDCVYCQQMRAERREREVETTKR